MYLLNGFAAVFYFYVLLFAVSLLVLLIGLRMLYVAYRYKDDELMRRAKFVLLFAVIALLCIGIVSFFETGKIPVN